MNRTDRDAIRYLRRHVESGETHVARLRERDLLEAVPALQKLAGRIAAMRSALEGFEADAGKVDEARKAMKGDLRDLLRLFGCDVEGHWATLGAQVKRACGEG